MPHKMPMRLTTRCQKNCMLKCPRNATENAIRMQENVPLKICFNASETVCKNDTDRNHKKAIKKAQIKYRILVK